MRSSPRSRLSLERRLAATQRSLGSARRPAASIQLRFDSLFAHNPDAVYALDRAGRCVSANEACETLTGYSVPELLSMRDWSLIVVRESYASLAERTRKTLDGEAQDFEVTIRHKSGRR